MLNTKSTLAPADIRSGFMELLMTEPDVVRVAIETARLMQGVCGPLPSIFVADASQPESAVSWDFGAIPEAGLFLTTDPLLSAKTVAVAWRKQTSELEFQIIADFKEVLMVTDPLSLSAVMVHTRFYPHPDVRFRTQLEWDFVAASYAWLSTKNVATKTMRVTTDGFMSVNLVGGIEIDN